MSEKLSKYITAFDYFDKILVVLSATSGGASIICFATVIGAPVGIAFYLTTGIIKKLLQIIRNKKKKPNKIAMLARSTLNSIETLTSKPLIDYEISHKE